MSIEFDVIIIGAGPGGYVAAIKAAKAGLNTAIVENRRVGGTCLNRGCIPAKAMIHASSLYREAVGGGLFGLSAEDAAFDYEGILKYKQETIDGLVGGIEQLLKANGVTVLEGTGTLLAPEDGVNWVRVTAGGDAAGAGGACDEAGAEGTCSADGVAGAGGACAEEGAGSTACAAEIYTADNVILAAGSKPARIPVPGMDLPHVIDSDGLFALEDAPQSLVIIGGGVIGVEFATVYSNLGTQVTIVEALPKLLDNFDKEISQNLKMILKKRGVEAHLNASVKECVAADDDWITCVFEEKGKSQELTAEYVLVAAGRTPVTDKLFGEGIEMVQAAEVDGVPGGASGAADSASGTPAPAVSATEESTSADPTSDTQGTATSRILMNRRFVAVDEHFRTSLPGVYAIGDLTGGIQLAHAASAHGARVVEEILQAEAASADAVGAADAAPAETDADGAGTVGAVPEGDAPAFAQNLNVIPGGVYTDPEIATVGLTEAQAKDRGLEVRTGKFIMSANGKSMITKEERGFIKVVADAESDRILGAQMMCARATDMIEEFTTAIVNGLTVHDMLRSVRPHPTYNEGIAEALEDVHGESTHTAPRRRR